MKKFLDSGKKHTLYKKDHNNREISYVKIKNVSLIGRNLFYPNVLLHTDDDIVNPYDEKIMSLNKDSFYDDDYNFTQLLNKSSSSLLDIKEPVFFFLYHFDNYYHFLYDTIPYLITYQYLKKEIPDLRLLVQYPNIVKDSSFYPFNTELLSKFVDIKQDLFMCDSRHCYHNVYVSSSFTHGGLSSFPPRKEIYPLYASISVVSHKTPSRIYISRRTWIHNDRSNIGTDYTTRRKMMNEDDLVRVLKDKFDIEEVFTEKMSTDEKINMFRNAELVIGSIGGGMANLLFSPSSTKSIVIVSPYFLDINNRFRYSMEHTNITYFENVSVYKEMNNIPLYCRVRILESNRIGELEDYKDNKYLIRLSNNDVSGFHNDVEFQECWFPESEFELIDKGLNSPYEINIKSLCEMINESLPDKK
jgi:hypothetical protein